MHPNRMPPPFRPTFPSQRGIGNRTIPNTGGVPPPRLPVPMWNPAPAAPSPVEGPNEGSGEGTIQTSQGQSMPPQAQASGGFMSKLRDPRFAAWLMSVGSTMGQPRQVGQTGWGQAAQAMGQGYNTLAMYNEMQRQREMQDRDQTLKEQQVAAGMAKTKSDIALGQKGAELGEKKIEQEERLTMTQVKAREAQLDKELALREKMSKADLDNDKAKWTATAEMSRAKLKQDATDTAAKRQLDEAELKLKATDIAMRGEYYKTQGKADLINAGANANRSAASGRLDDAQAQSIKDGTGRTGRPTGNSGVTTEYQRAQISSKILAQIDDETLTDDWDEATKDREYQKRMALVFPQDGQAANAGGPPSNLPDGTRVKNNQDGKIYIMKGGKPVPEDQQPGQMQPGEVRLDPKKKSKAFPND